MRQRLQVKPVNLAPLQDIPKRRRDRFTVANSEQHFRGAALDDLMQNERRQVIEQMRVVHTDNNRGASRCGSQRLKYTADKLQCVRDGRPHPRSKGAQRKFPPR
jgi:hypothetical protein